MKNWIKHCTLGLAFALSTAVNAADKVENFELVKQKIQNTLGMKVSSIADSPIPGLLQLETDKGLFYSSENGKFLLQARVYNLDEGMRNETEIALSQMRLAGVDEFKNSVIEYKAKDEKYVVDVFTDISCGYCRKLHGEMAQYNDLGITIRYLAYPRDGLRGQTYKNMVSVWCAENPQKAMDNAKSDKPVTPKSCESQVAEQYAFGQMIGVNGTPNIILPDGSLIPGYQPPKMLEQALKAL
tara:strand:- start:464 stop:1186 length:723 start_codon:yes stop_codon:yes gene_type:complete